MKRGWTLALLLLAVYAMALAGCGDNAFDFLADDSSQEACKFKVTQAIDSGNFNEVLNLTCADHIDRGAAYMGTAGFTFSKIIESMTDANKMGASAIDVYLNSMVKGGIDRARMRALFNAQKEYSQVTTFNGYTMDMINDAKFYNSVMVQFVIDMSQLKGVIDYDTNGRVTQECDLNANGSPDEADAMACALVYAGGGTADCVAYAPSNVTSASPLNFAITDGLTQTYEGITVTFAGSGVDNDGNACPNVYKELRDMSSILVSTTSDQCTADTDSSRWPCPFEDASGLPISTVESLNQTLNSSPGILSSLGISSNSETYIAIIDFQSDACGGNICTNTEIADYLAGNL